MSLEVEKINLRIHHQQQMSLQFTVFRQGLLADKMMLGVGETSSSDTFHCRLLAIHKELGELLQTVGTHKITYMVR